MARNAIAVIPASYWNGESETRPAIEGSGISEKPDHCDWNRLFNEFNALQKIAMLLYTNTAPATVVTNDTAETAFDKTVTIPGGTLKPGDLLKIRARVLVTGAQSTDELTIKLYIGTVVVGTIAAEDVATNEEAYIEAECFINAAGKVQVHGRKTAFAAPASWSESGYGIAEATMVTTGDLVVSAKATWSVAHASNIAKLTEFTVELQRGRTN